MGVPPGQGRARSPLPDLCQLTRCVTGPLHHSGQWGSAPRTPPRLGWLWLPSGGAGPTGWLLLGQDVGAAGLAHCRQGSGCVAIPVSLGPLQS